jgi:hypothetical protein
MCRLRASVVSVGITDSKAIFKIAEIMMRFVPVLSASTLYRCRALVGRIGEELRKKKPEHFVDERSLADIHASLERAAWVLEQKTGKGLQERAHQRPGDIDLAPLRGRRDTETRTS